jgi:hypothetical protein
LHRPVSNVFHNRLLVAVDWIDPSAFDEEQDEPLDDSSYVAFKVLRGL